MASLQIAPERSSSSLPAVLLALVLLAAIAAAIFYFNPHKVADFKVLRVDTYEPHTTFNAMEGATPAPNGMHVLDSGGPSVETNLYVVAHLSLTDKLRLPLFLSGATARATLADGTVLESSLLSRSDLKRLEVIFPAIAQQAPAPISDGDEIAPGQTLQGSLVLAFPGQTVAAWHSKKAATLRLDLRNQEAQTIALP